MLRVMNVMVTAHCESFIFKSNEYHIFVLILLLFVNTFFYAQ